MINIGRLQVGLMTELEVEDAAAFKNVVRVEPAMFRELLNRLGPEINTKDTFYRKALHPDLRPSP